MHLRTVGLVNGGRHSIWSPRPRDMIMDRLYDLRTCADDIYLKGGKGSQ